MRSPSLPSRSRASLAALGVTVTLFAAACGSDSASSQVASLGTTAGNTATDGTTPANTQEAWLAFAQCMRDNGIDMEDPTFDADGNIQSGGLFGPNSGLDMQDETTRTALDSCRDLIGDIGPGGGNGGGNFDRTAIQDAFNTFIECLRDQGLDVDDITFGAGPGGGGPGGGATPGTGDVPQPPTSDGAGGGGFQGGPPPGAGGDGQGFDPTARIIEQLGLDDTDPAVTTALDACQPALESAFNQNAPGATTDATTATTDSGS